MIIYCCCNNNHYPRQSSIDWQVGSDFFEEKIWNLGLTSFLSLFLGVVKILQEVREWILNVRAFLAKNKLILYEGDVFLIWTSGLVAYVNVTGKIELGREMVRFRRPTGGFLNGMKYTKMREKLTWTDAVERRMNCARFFCTIDGSATGYMSTVWENISE